jgi:hypothetical protein
MLANICRGHGPLLHNRLLSAGFIALSQKASSSIRDKCLPHLAQLPNLV